MEFGTGVLKLGWVDTSIGGSIVEVVIEGVADVGIAFNDCWSQVLVALNDHEVVLLAKPRESFPLVGEQIVFSMAAAGKFGLQAGLEIT